LESGKGLSLTGRGACDFLITPVVAGWRDTTLVNNNSDRAVLYTLANNSKGRESFTRNMDILITYFV
jgi:hypothetical protein